MDIKTLTDTLSVSPQIKHQDVSDIAALGFKTIINNRPDQEVLYQPRTQTLADHAKRAGLEYLYLPVVPGAMTQANIDDFAALLATMPGPVLAFCRTGTRSATLWARANPDDISSAEISRIGAQAGYSL
ncbi:MAG: TIGR01244 family sulfur transferase [Litorimonas sp.]